MALRVTLRALPGDKASLYESLFEVYLAIDYSSTSHLLESKTRTSKESFYKQSASLLSDADSFSGSVGMVSWPSIILWLAIACILRQAQLTRA